MDMGFLESLRTKGGLTEEEMRRVRDSMLRQAATQQTRRQPSTSIEDLRLFAVTAAQRQTPPQSTASPVRLDAPAAQPETALPPAPEAPAPPPQAQAPEPAPPPQPANRPVSLVSLEVLLEKGLIAQEDYDALKRSQAKEK